MSTLTGQQIKDTYDGLLKLADSTTGITSSLQSIQDGLGNDTGARIGTNLFTAPNVMGMNTMYLKPQWGGNGVGTGVGTSPPGGTQGYLTFGYFYDFNLSYSALTYQVSNATTTGDVVEVFFYDVQWITDYGVFPRNLVLSAGTLDVSTLGLKTLTFPSPLSFSGTGPGYYIVLLRYTNSGVTPTARFNAPALTTSNQSLLWGLGLVRSVSNNQPINWGNRAASFQGNTWYFLNLQTLPSTFTEADIVSRFNTLVSNSLLGFGLHTIR